MEIWACRRKRRRAFGLRPVPSLPSRPFGFNPSRLRAYGAARSACLQGTALRAIPAAMVGPRASTSGLPAAGCANTCRPQRWRFAPTTSRRTVHANSGKPARPRWSSSTPRLKTSAARCGGGVLACRRAVDLARVSGRAAAAFMRGCRVGPISLRCGSAQGVLVSL